ncbi:MAG: zf-HC2 domain-containing protein [Nocardioides sp.]|nr:zf-HC2 domain-containing protein [Nocardioides sp.]
MTCHVESDLGAYVLHALEIEEAEAISEHLTTCDSCRAEARSLAATAGLLTLLQPEDFLGLDDTQGEYGDPTRQDRNRRHRRRFAPATMGAAATLVVAVLAAVLVVGIGRPTHDPAPPSSRAVAHAVNPATDVRAAVAMVPQASGTRLRLTLTGGAPHGWCSLVVHSRSGRTETAASWWANAEGEASVSGTTAIRADQLTEFDVVTHAGRLLLSIPVHHPSTTDRP